MRLLGRYVRATSLLLTVAIVISSKSKPSNEAANIIKERSESSSDSLDKVARGEVNTTLGNFNGKLTSQSPANGTMSTAVVLFKQTNTMSSDENGGQTDVNADLHRNRTFITALSPFQGKEKKDNKTDDEKPDWKEIKDNVETGVNALKDIINVVQDPTTENVVKVAQSVMNTIAIFLPAVGPFASAIFGLISLFMPGSVRS